MAPLSPPQLRLPLLCHQGELSKSGTPQSLSDFVGRGKIYEVFIMHLLANVFKHEICFDELRG